MRKFILAFLSFISIIPFVMACGHDEEFFDDLIVRTDTLYRNDTILHTDTTYINGDTIITNDTIIKTDTIVNKDTVVAQEKIKQPDSLMSTDIILTYYMNPRSSSGTLQGAASYDNYLFQFNHSNNKIFICDLSSKQNINTIELPAISSNHCNNISFSNIFYDKGDDFPLLYVSGSNSGTYNHVQVYRITKSQDYFQFIKIQEIILPESSDYNYLYWTGVVLDNENNYMYVYANYYNGEIAKFKIPDIHREEVVLTNSDILDLFPVWGFTHQQGAIIKNSIMYVLDGIPARGDTNYLRLINLKEKKDQIIYNLSEAGYGNYEYEGITFYNDSTILVTTNNNKGIYSVILNNTK